jgi:hypothetical protein
VFLKSIAMIEYAKVILPKVIFSRDLFRKELLKCIGWVDKEEVGELHNWCLENFNKIYPDILSEVFDNIAA